MDGVANPPGSRVAKTIAVVVVGVIAALFLIAYFGTSYYRDKGKELFDGGRIVDSRAYFSRAYALSLYRDPMSAAHLGIIAMGQRNTLGLIFPAADLGAAQGFYESALASGIQGEDPAIHRMVLNDLGYIYLKMGKDDEALQKYLESISLYSRESAWPRFRASFIYLARKIDPDSALEILLPAIRSDSETPVEHIGQLTAIYAQAAKIYDAKGDLEQARRFAELALDLPDYSLDKGYHVAAHLTLAFAAGLRGDFNIAENSIRAANEIRGGQDRFDCYLANIYLRGGNLAKAAAIAEAAMPSAQNGYVRAYCALTLGRAYLATGRSAEGQEYLKEFLAINETLFPPALYLQQEELAIRQGNSG